MEIISVQQSQISVQTISFQGSDHDISLKVYNDLEVMETISVHKSPIFVQTISFQGSHHDISLKVYKD